MIIKLTRDLHFDEIREFRELLLEEIRKGHNRIIVDLSRLPAITSMVLSVLLESRRECTECDGGFHVTGLSPFIAELLERSKTKEILDPIEDLEGFFSSLGETEA